MLSQLQLTFSNVEVVPAGSGEQRKVPIQPIHRPDIHRPQCPGCRGVVEEAPDADANRCQCDSPQQPPAKVRAKHAANKKMAYENILWALLNTKEFVFNQ